MAYTFEHIPRRTYPKTFLKDVHLYIGYPQRVMDNVTVDKLTQFYQQNFHLDVSVAEVVNGVSFTSLDEKVRIEFLPDRICLISRFPVYKSFESLQDFWFPLFKKYFQIVGVTLFNKLVLSKYNELDFQLQNDETTLTDLLKMVYSKDVLELASSDIERNESFLNNVRREWIGSMSSDDDMNSVFNYEFGFRKNSDDLRSGVLTLKTTVTSGNISIDIERGLKKIICYNDVLFDGFHWCVNKGIINKMSV